MLEDLRIASPCSANWDEMTGDERKRFCQQCKLHVYNISAMNRRQAEDFLKESLPKGRVCVKMYRRADGTVITDDCPLGLRKLRDQGRKVALQLAGICASALGMLLSFSTPRANSQEMGDVAPARPLPVAGQAVMGRYITGKAAFHPAANQGGASFEPPVPVQPVRATMGELYLPESGTTTVTARLLAGNSAWRVSHQQATRGAIASITCGQEDIEKSTRALLIAADQAEAKGENLRAAVSLNNAANCLFYAGNYGQAKKLYAAALSNAYANAEKEERLPLQSVILNNMVVAARTNADSDGERSAMHDLSAAMTDMQYMHLTASLSDIAWLSTEFGGTEHTAAPPPKQPKARPAVRR